MRILPRTYILISLAFLSPIRILAHPSTRRSLNFGPRLKSDFSTDASQLPIIDSRDPHQVAHIFLSKLAHPGGYFIREDSYTDENTGISHIYARQVVNGLEVADGNVNLNIRGDQVLSYGNSFFDGSVESDISSVPNWHQEAYCSDIQTRSGNPVCGSTLEYIQGIASRSELVLFNHQQNPCAAAFFLLHLAHPDPASLVLSLAALKAERHDCAVTHEDMDCQDWLVTGFSDGLKPISARRVYVQTPGDHGSTYLNLAWKLEISLLENHYVGYVSVHDPSKIISIADMIVDAPIPDSDGFLSTLERYIFGKFQEAVPFLDPLPDNVEPKADSEARVPFPTIGFYYVWKWGVNDPDGGRRTLEAAPVDRSASPLGWHSVPAGNDPLKTLHNLDKNEILDYNTTVGNNVIAQENWAGKNEWKNNRRADGGAHLIFFFPYGADSSEPGWEKVEPPQYIDMSISQLFYTANMYHDLLYHYGFDEASGNFQQHNFRKKGAEDDAVILQVQDGQTRNGASFTITADGTKPVCRMHIWDKTGLLRDGGLDAGILIHELSHGLSGRLTGGPSNKECLSDYESRGMGEGWSDFIATTVRSTSTYRDYPIGAWANNNTVGERHYPYSTGFDVNPFCYNQMQDIRPWYPHYMGEVWAEVLYVVSNKLIEKHGFADSLFPSSQPDFYQYLTRKDGGVSKFPKHGNTLMLQLVVNGMKRQPCNPTFLQARKAIIEADEELTNGENKCALWEAFASRGLGTDAKKLVIEFLSDGDNQDSINGFDVPPECKKGSRLEASRCEAQQL